MILNYFKILANILFAVISFGIIGPYLISFNDTLLVLLGVVYVLVVTPTIFYFFNKNFPVKFQTTTEGE